MRLECIFNKNCWLEIYVSWRSEASEIICQLKMHTVLKTFAKEINPHKCTLSCFFLKGVPGTQCRGICDCGQSLDQHAKISLWTVNKSLSILTGYLVTIFICGLHIFVRDHHVDFAWFSSSAIMSPPCESRDAS